MRFQQLFTLAMMAASSLILFSELAFGSEGVDRRPSSCDQPKQHHTRPHSKHKKEHRQHRHKSTQTKSEETPVKKRTHTLHKVTTTVPSDLAKQMLDLHNSYRSKHAVASLTWSDTLASSASSWALNCVFQHTPALKVGQNLAIGTGSSFSASQSAKMWYDEMDKYDYNKPTFTKGTGHFTQMVWKKTTKIGCAVHKCNAAKLGLGGEGEALNVVCNYEPAGNAMGQFRRVDCEMVDPICKSNV